MTFYKVILSTGKAEIIIDQEDYAKITQLSGAGALIRVKQGIINPSFIVAIVPTKVEVKKKTEGYIDKERNVFVVTKEEEVPALEDKFSNKLLLGNDEL